jgi:hypothetical protein
MVASGQRAGIIDEGLQPFRKGIGLRGVSWRDLRVIIALRKPRRHVLRIATGTASARSMAA